jgi:hypothetical protein
VVPGHPTSGAAYRAQLADVIRRAKALETRAREECASLDPTDPQHASWLRIERRYATIRGNAEHLLLIHQIRHQRSQSLSLIRRSLKLLNFIISFFIK